MSAILKRCRAGFNGGVSRESQVIREARLLKETTGPDDYGFPVKLNDDGTISALAAGDDGTGVFGLLVRPYPAMTYPKPPEDVFHDVMIQGYMTVAVVSGTVVAKGAVYVRNTAAADHSIGEISADNAAGTVALPNAYFTGPASAGEDGDLIAEIAYKIY